MIAASRHHGQSAEDRGSAGRLRALELFFTLTGLTGLVTEQVFEKLLSTVVGATTPAGTIVLAVFFLGLTIGGYLFAAVARRVDRPLRFYAGLVAFVGLWDLLLAALLSPLLGAMGQIVAAGGNSATMVFVLRALVAGAVILPPTIAMGMTFPAVVSASQQLAGARARMVITRLYGLNLVGALCGSLAGAYLLFPHLGLRGTLLLMAGVELGVALWATRFGDTRASGAVARARGRVESATGLAARVQSAIGGVLDGPGGLGLLALAFYSGFQVFSLEVIWLQLAGTVLGTSVYAFSLMLSAVLFGLAIGSLATSLLQRRAGSVDPLWLAAALVGSAALLAVTHAPWDAVGNWMVGARGWADSFAKGELVRAAIAVALIAPPTAALGTLFPLIFSSARFPVDRAAAAAGLLVAANAVGSILGALLTGFVLLPSLGTDATYRSFVVVLWLLGATFAWRSAVDRATGRVRTAPFALTVVAIAGCLFTSSQRPWHPLGITSGANVYFAHGFIGPDTRLAFFHEDTYGGFTTVVERPLPGGGRQSTLLTNGKFQGNDTGERAAQTGFALIPILHVRNRDRALVIGLGTGQTAAIVAASGFARFDIVEIAPGIVAAARERFGHVNAGVLRDPRARVVIEDGRNHLLRTDNDYDLITIEVSSVWFAGASNLYSHEFYQTARRRLRSDGILQQWIQIHHISAREVLSIIATLRSVFEHVSMWIVGGQGVLVASQAPLQMQNFGLIERLQADGHLDALDLPEGVPTIEGLRSKEFLRPAEVDRIALDFPALRIPINTDANRFIEYATPRYNLERRSHRAEVLNALAVYVDDHQRERRLELTRGLPGAKR